MYLDSTDDVPEDDIDRINIRDNLKLAQVNLLVSHGIYVTVTASCLPWSSGQMKDTF